MPNKPKVFRIISQGGIGDALLLTPAFRAIKEQYPDCRLMLFCPVKQHMEIYRHNPYVDSLKSASFLADPVNWLRYRFKPARFYHVNYGSLTPSKSYAIHASEIIAEMLGIRLADRNASVFLTAEEEARARQFLSGFKNPVVIHITSSCSANQNWPLKNWESLISSMPDFAFLQLGLPREAAVKGAVDLRGKTSIRESIALIKYAKSFVGVVSSMAHATNAVNAPGVVLYGPSTPVIWGHPNNVNLYKRLRCAPCVDVLGGVPCPYGSECMSRISVEEVKNAVLQQVAGKAAPRPEVSPAEVL